MPVSNQGRPHGFAPLLILACAALAWPAERAPAARTPALKVIELKEPDGQILSYRHLAGSLEVFMRGTRRAPEARIKLKIGSRPGFVELDINRGGITGLKPAHRLGRDFLTYVLWAVAPDGRASNLGEITFENDQPVAVNLTTPYQTFWLMVTAEPNYAVVDPSPEVVLYSVKDASGGGSKAIPVESDLFYFTHYSKYDSGGGDLPARVPNQLLQARKAVELAIEAGVSTGDHSNGSSPKENAYSRKALLQARTFLDRAEASYREEPKRQEVIQFARTAAQSAENARALAMGAVGGVLVRELESEVVSLRGELTRAKTPVPAVVALPVDETPEPVCDPPPPVVAEERRPVIAPPLARQPALWFAVAGWGLAIVLLFRRRQI